jgi:hypothetical protein
MMINDPVLGEVEVVEDNLMPSERELLDRYRRSQSEKGKRGGKSRSERKVRAVRENLKLAQRARLHKGERHEPVETVAPVPDQVV